MTVVFNPRALLLVAVLGITSFLALAIGPIMHESDQASLVRGAIRIAEGRTSPWAADFYNYDKQFASYWSLAIANRLAPGVDPVLLGNIVSFGIFWSGLLVLIASSRIQSVLPATGVLACMVSPAIWVHSPFLASTFLASGFLFWAWSFWRFSAHHRGLRGLAILVLVWSIGCRADVVLLVPLLAWLATPVSGFVRMARRGWPYLLLAAAVGAILLGRAVTTGGVVDVHPPFFYPKIFAAYLVFGLGAAGLVVAGHVVGLVRVAWRRRGRTTWIFYALGMAGTLLPLAYYSLQMFSPRYWVVTLCGQILLLCSRRGGLIFKTTTTAAGRWMTGTLAILCLGPVFLGFRVPSLSSPRLVVAEPTCFPSADGHIPMGAMAWYIWSQRLAPEMFDHNHATWLAARSVDYHEGPGGAVPLSLSALRTYAELAVEMQGKESVIASLDDPFFYIDLRQVLRANNVFTGMNDMDRGRFFDRYRVEPVSRNVNGHVIVRGETGGESSDDVLRDLTLAEIFQGAEFAQPSPFDAVQMRKAAAFGRSTVLYSPTPFAVRLPTDGEGTGEKRAVEVPRLGYALRLSASEAARAAVSTGESDLHMATARLPDYMDLQNL